MTLLQLGVKGKNMKTQKTNGCVLEILLQESMCDDFLQVFSGKDRGNNASHSQLGCSLSHPRIDELQWSELFIQCLCLLQDLDQVSAVLCYIPFLKHCKDRERWELGSRGEGGKPALVNS